jgi:hypothetical protein
MIKLIAPTLALALALPASAEDLSFLDLRLGGGVLSNHFKGKSTTTVDDGSGNVTSSSSSESGRDSDSNYRGQLQLVYGNLGPAGGIILGGGIAANHATFDNGSQDAKVTTPAVDLLIGYGIAVTPMWHFELTPFAGAGRAYYSVTDNGNTDTSKEWTKYVEYGAKLGTYVTFAGSLQLGVEAIYLVGRFEPDYDYDDGADRVSVSDKRRMEGFGGLVTLGGRF